MNIVITIGRQFGSGGREIGRALAQALGIEYYDKELLAQAARAAGLNPALFEHNDERMPDLIGGSIGFSMGYGEIPWYSGQIMAADTVHSSIVDLINDIATRHSCVIVGRSADYVLRNRTDIRLVSIFVHAPMAERVRRILARAPELNERSARALAEKTDRARASYYNFFTDKRWGDSRSYDLTLNSALLPLPDLITTLTTYLSLREKQAE